MRTVLLPHALNRKFPALAAGVAPMGDVELEGLKKVRPHLKDPLYRLASAAKRAG